MEANLNTSGSAGILIVSDEVDLGEVRLCCAGDVLLLFTRGSFSLPFPTCLPYAMSY